MNRHVLARTLAAVATIAAIVCAGSSVAMAKPAVPGGVPAIGISEGIGYSVHVHGHDITYRASRVPRIPVIGPISLPGSCTTALVDAIKAAPIVGPDIIDLIQGGDVDVLALLTGLIEADAIAAAPSIRTADSDNVLTGTFAKVPTGIYAVLSVCNLNTNLYGAAGAFVIGPSWESGSAEGGGSSFGSSYPPPHLPLLGR